jgi:hypothetical protein
MKGGIYMTYEEQMTLEANLSAEMKIIREELRKLQSRRYKLKEQKRDIRREQRAIIAKRPARLKDVVQQLKAGVLYTPTMVNNMFVSTYPDDYNFSIQQLHLAAKEGGKRNRHYTDTDLFYIGLIRTKVGSKYYYKKGC